MLLGIQGFSSFSTVSIRERIPLEPDMEKLFDSVMVLHHATANRQPMTCAPCSGQVQAVRRGGRQLHGRPVQGRGVARRDLPGRLQLLPREPVVAVRSSDALPQLSSACIRAVRRLFHP